MKQEAESQGSLLTSGRSRKLSLIVIGGVVLLAVLAMVMVIMITKEPTSPAASPPAESSIKAKGPAGE